MKIPFFNIEVFRTKEENAVPATIPKDPVILDIKPRSGGRESEPEGASLLGLLEEYSVTQPDFQAELLGVLEHLAKYNPDVSYAVDNVVQLGNTNFTIYFDDSVTDAQSKVIVAALKDAYKKWYAYSGGISSLINDLLAQMAIYGCISGECVPSLNLDGLQKTILVNPKSIRFIYDIKTEGYLPYQITKRVIAGGEVKQGMIPLNPVTYKYFAARRFSEKPYGIPGFLSALDNIAIEKDMLCNFRNIIKKLGILGFLHVLVKAPQKLQTETEEQYKTKAARYLDSVVPELEKSMAKGYVVGFKDTHDFKMDGTAVGNVAGAKELFNMNSEMKMAGLKQDPLMLGRNFSTTETIGRVILTKLASQVTNFQMGAASFLESAFTLQCVLMGYKFKFLEVVFDPPLLGDAVRDETAQTAKIVNNISLYNQGVISQQQVAQNLGYEKPDVPEPRQVFLPTTNPDLVAKDAASDDPTNPKTTDVDENLQKEISGVLNLKGIDLEVYTANKEAALGKFSPEFDYCIGVCNHGIGPEFSFDKMVQDYEGNKASKKLGEYLRSYSKETVSRYRKAVNKVTRDVGTIMANLGTGTPVAEVTDKVLASMYTNWGTYFNKPQKAVIQKWVTAAYKAFRTDKSVFGESYKDSNLPTATFTTVDFRTIDYYKKSDSLYLGKFITDEDTKKKITEFIKTEFIENGLPIGKGQEGIALFKEKFSTVLKGEDWKIQRILNTTVNKMRNSAAVSYIDQAEVTQFKIVGVNDRLQCGYCKALQGKVFEVRGALDKIDELSKTSPEMVKEVTPFVTSLFKKPEEMANLSAAELQARGIASPPFHSNCRDVIVAEL